ncbi:MAG: RNA polymerase sigma factor [Oscillospiraceae bacterium]|nr:RNA polymerase sigma factor [Oscillospiraceae bacterium]
MIEKEKLVSMVIRAQKGDNDGATALYDTFYQDIYYYILKTVSDPELAADLTQDTFMEILQTIGQLNEPAAFVTWSRQIAYHRCTAHFRKRKELLADEDEDGYSVFDTIEEDRTEFIPDAALDQADLKATIHRMIDSLPEEQRSALLMRYFEELSVSQIATIQGVSEGTVKSRLNYGRKAIGKAVEDYEKKNGVKLHCAGVVPLLLWLFTSGSNGSAAGTAAAGATAGSAAVGAGITTKIIAGITAAVVALGGITAAVLLTQPEPESYVQEDPMQWYGYGESIGFNHIKRFDLSIDQMDDSTISGHLEVSLLYEEYHDTNFAGTGTVNDDGTIQYTLQFETPVSFGMSSHQYWDTELIYDPVTENLTFADIYKVTMVRHRVNPQIQILSQNERWSGEGLCDFCFRQDAQHEFVLQITKMTDTAISGELIVLRDGEVEHTSTFTGRGYLTDAGASYEVQLDTPRTDTAWMSKRTVQFFWMHFDQEADTLTIDDITYTATCAREKFWNP